MPYKNPELKRAFQLKRNAQQRLARSWLCAFRPEEVKARDAAHHAKNREKRNAYSAKQYKENPNYWVQYRAEHPEVSRGAAAQWRATHPGWSRVAYAKNPERFRAIANNYRHKKRANGGHFPRASWEHLKVLFGHRCAYCGRRMERLTIDHVVPISRGGWHFSGNIVPSCRSCNPRKGNRLLSGKGLTSPPTRSQKDKA